MLKLYGGARSRAFIVQWWLEELGVPYEFVLLDMQAGEHRQSDYLAINPFGKVPAIVDGNFKLWESGAILLYLTDKYGKANLSLEQRSILNQWILFANSTFGPEIVAESTREKATVRYMTLLNQLFEQQPFILGSEFSVADVAVGSLLGYVSVMLRLIDLSPYPAVLEYTQRIAQRPAFQTAVAARQ